MSVRGFKRAAVGLAAATAMVGGMALASPMVAGADETPDVPLIEAPELEVTQDGNGVAVKITPPPLGSCGVAAVELGKALDVLDDPESALVAGPGITLFPAATTLLGAGSGEDSKELADGVYVVIATCGGEPAIQPIIVPTGIGSLASGLEFGSAALSNPALLSLLMGMVGGLG